LDLSTHFTQLQSMSELDALIRMAMALLLGGLSCWAD